VFWNSNVYAEVIQNIPQFYDDITRTPYWSGLNEYATFNGGTGQGFLTGSATAGVTLTPSRCPASTTTSCSVSDAQIQTELIAQFTAGHIPAPSAPDCTGNSTTVYMIHFPANVKITGPAGAGTSCVQFCAYHNTGTYNSAPLVYGVIADEYSGGCATGCGANAASGGHSAAFNNLTDSASHELVEAATDPDIGLDTQAGYANPAAWGDNNNQCGEISDICDSDFPGDSLTYQGRTWLVQQWWSNKLNSCVSSDPSLAAICAPSGECQGEASCAHSAGPCDYDTVADGTACTAQLTCEQAACTSGVCDVVSNTCQCTHDSDCASSAGPCQVGTCAIPAGACQFANAPEGTACTGGTCDANGNCAIPDAGPGPTTSSSSSSSSSASSSGSTDSSSSSSSSSSTGTSDSSGSTGGSSGSNDTGTSGSSDSGSSGASSSGSTDSSSSTSASSGGTTSSSSSSASSSGTSSSSSASSTTSTTTTSSSSSGTSASSSSSGSSSGGQETTSTTSSGSSSGSTGTHASATAAGSTTGGGAKADSGGCGCTSTPDASALGGLAFALLGLRRRRARG